jgi:hypothetical protein
MAKKRQGFFLELLGGIVLVLLFTLFTRELIVYTNPTHTLGIPDTYFSWRNLGHDFETNFTVPATNLLRSVPIDQTSGYGYGTGILTVTAMQGLTAIKLCSADAVSCGYLIYRIVISICILGYFLFALYIPKQKETKILGALLLATSLLGIGMSRGLEAGNSDLFLSLILASLVYLIGKGRQEKQYTFFAALILGVAGGFLIHIKLLMLPVIVFFIIFSPSRIVTFVTFLFSYLIFLRIPIFYGVPTSVTDILRITDSTLNPMKDAIYTAYPYGSLTLRAFASGIINSIFKTMPISYRYVALPVLAVGIGVVLLIPSGIILLQSKIWKTLKTIPYINTNIMYILYGIIIISMILLPIVAFEYRLIYFVPLFILLLDPIWERGGSTWFTTAVVFFFLKNSWILSGRLTTVFFYISISCLFAAFTQLFIRSIHLRLNRRI